MNKMVARFQRMDLEDIHSQPIGKWADADLLDVLEVLAKAERVEETRARERAVRSLILHSPDHSEMVAYEELYLAQGLALQYRGDFEAAIANAYAALVYNLQHDEDFNAYTWRSEIAGLYLAAGEHSVGIAQYARLLRGKSTDLFCYNRLIDSLHRAGLFHLAQEVLDASAGLANEDADPGDLSEWQEQQAKLAEVDWASQSEDLHAIDPAVLADLRAVFSLTHNRQEEETEYLLPISRLLDGKSGDVSVLYDGITAHGQTLVPELLYLAWDYTLSDGPAPDHAIKLLRSLADKHPARFADIDRWLDQAEGDWRNNLYDDFGQIGGYTPAELRQWAANPAYAWAFRSAANEALTKRAERHPDERAQIVDFLTKLLNRPGSEANVDEETFTASVIGNLCDLGAQDAYPAIETAFQQDRVDLQMLDLDYVQERLELPRTTPPLQEDGLYLNLICKRCGRGRPHFVQHVTLDLGTQRRKAKGQPARFDPYVMDREIVCPKCGAKDSYELRGFDVMRLMIPLYGDESFLALLRDQVDRPLFRPGPRLTRSESIVFGRSMHPLEGLAEYRRRIQRNPTNADLHLRMALIFRSLHRFEKCLDTVRQAHEIRPNDPEVMTFRAFFEHDFGDKAMAEELYRRAIPVLQQGMRRSKQMVELMALAAEGLAALKGGEPSPWQPEQELSDGDDPPSEERTQQPARGKGKKKRRK